MLLADDEDAACSPRIKLRLDQNNFVVMTMSRLKVLLIYCLAINGFNIEKMMILYTA